MGEAVGGSSLSCRRLGAPCVHVGFDPDSCTGVVLENSVIRAGDDCVAIYSVRGPTSNVTVRNVTCHTPLTITHGNWGTSGVLFEDCTVRGDWGGDHTYRPRWWKTAMRLKSDRHTNGTLQHITYRNIHAVGVDLLFDIQMWYALCVRCGRCVCTCIRCVCV